MYFRFNSCLTDTPEGRGAGLELEGEKHLWVSTSFLLLLTKVTAMECHCRLDLLSSRATSASWRFRRSVAGRAATLLAARAEFPSRKTPYDLGGYGFPSGSAYPP